MKAVIENRDGHFYIRIYGSDGLPCDAYAVNEISFSDVISCLLLLREANNKKEEE